MRLVNEPMESRWTANNQAEKPEASPDTSGKASGFILRIERLEPGA